MGFFGEEGKNKNSTIKEKKASKIQYFPGIPLAEKTLDLYASLPILMLQERGTQTHCYLLYSFATRTSLVSNQI